MLFQRKMVDDILHITDENGKSMLEIKEKIEGNDLVISVFGDIKSEVALEFEDELLAALTTGKPLVVDFAGVNYISSTGLRALLSAQRMIDELGKSSLCLKNLTKSMIEIFEANGFLDLIEIKQ